MVDHVLDWHNPAWDPVARRMIYLPRGSSEALVNLVERLGLKRLRRRCKADDHHSILQFLEDV